MSIYQIENYRYSIMHEPQPAWEKLERYEFCDSYVNAKNEKKKKGLKALIGLFTLA